MYLYLSTLFAGFPFASIDAKNRLYSLTRLGVIWTIARIVWGFAALTSVMKGWLVTGNSRTEYYTGYILLVLIFLVSEVIPIFISLQESILSSFSDNKINSNLTIHHHDNNQLNILTHTQNETNTNGISMSLINKIKNGLHQDLDSYGSMITREKNNGARYLELTGANLHIASLDLEDAIGIHINRGYVREEVEDHHNSIKKNRVSLLSFQSDDMSMYTANEYDMSDNDDNTINSDSLSCSFSESDATSNTESQSSPRKKKRWFFF